MGLPKGRFTLWMTNTSLWLLLTYWLAVYTVSGVFFALVYWSLPSGSVKSDSGSIEQFLDLLHFSYTTQATVGYGDYYPAGIARLVAAIQAVIGIGLNSVALGIMTYKFLKRSAPVRFSSALVYDPVNHAFMFRFWDIDADDLRDVKITCTVFYPRPSRSYDTVNSKIAIDYDQITYMPSLHLFLLKTKSNDGTHRGEIGQAGDLVVSPLHLSPGTTVRIDLAGYFHSTGDAFYINKDYSIYALRCGKYEGIGNGLYPEQTRVQRASRTELKLSLTVATSADECKRCPYHAGCLLDVAVGLRKG